MSDAKSFAEEVQDNISRMKGDSAFKGMSQMWQREAVRYKYGYNFSWMGRPIIQFPHDIYAAQELIWTVKPDLIIETGIAHGGSIILSASILAMLDYSDAVANGETLDPKKSNRKVLGIDIDIRSHNREAIEAHPMAHMIHMIEGSSIDEGVIEQVHDVAKPYKNIMVMLDSNHTHAHVLAELQAYAPLIAKGSYCVVWDSGIEDLPDGFVTDRPWGKGNNPKSALLEYLDTLDEGQTMARDGEALKLEIDDIIEHKIMVSAASSGFLRRY